MSVICTYREGFVEVGDGTGPVIRWSPVMWEECVWSRVAAGNLPALAYNVDDGPAPVGTLARIPSWSGGAVTWDATLFGEGRLEISAEDWRAFVEQIVEGSLSVEALVGTDPGKEGA